jgi:hypothetical protein
MISSNICISSKPGGAAKENQITFPMTHAWIKRHNSIILACLQKIIGICMKPIRMQSGTDEKRDRPGFG